MPTVTRYIHIPRKEVDIVSLCVSEAMKAEGFALEWSDSGQPWVVRGTMIKDGVEFATNVYWTLKRGSLPWRESVFLADDARYVAIVTTVDSIDDSAFEMAKQTNDHLLATYRQYMQQAFLIVGETTGCLDHGS